MLLLVQRTRLHNDESRLWPEYLFKGRKDEREGIRRIFMDDDKTSLLPPFLSQVSAKRFLHFKDVSVLSHIEVKDAVVVVVAEAPPLFIAVTATAAAAAVPTSTAAEVVVHNIRPRQKGSHLENQRDKDVLRIVNTTKREGMAPSTIGSIANCRSAA